jgi:uncharacterized protein with GYD domain
MTSAPACSWTSVAKAVSMSFSVLAFTGYRRLTIAAARIDHCAPKDAPKRAEAARELAKKVGIEIKEVYLTSGDDDLLVIVDTPNGDNVAKFALALGSQGNVRTRTARAWPQSEFQKLISELP